MKEHFQKLRSNLELNDTFKGVIKTRHAAIRSVIANNHSNVVETKLIGSLQRQTRIQPRQGDVFDIDILVVLGAFNQWVPYGGVTPEEALEGVYTATNDSDRYATKNPKKDAPTVTLEFQNNIKVELVPAYVDNIGHSPSGVSVFPKGRGYWVPNNGRWEHADYDFDADYITKQNVKSDKWLVPTIKMLKAIRRECFPRLESFPLEIIAGQLIPLIIIDQKKRGKQISSTELLEIFFGVVKDSLASSQQVPGSNSSPVSIDAVTIKFAFDTIYQYIRILNNPSTSQVDKIEGWKKLFGDSFPTRI